MNEGHASTFDNVGMRACEDASPCQRSSSRRMSPCWADAKSISRSKQSLPDAQAVGIVIGTEVFTVCLSDGRQISVPYYCFPRLDAATPQQRGHFEVLAGGRMLHWPEIDEDIEVAHVVAGRMPVKKERSRTIGVAESRTKYGR